MQSFTRALRSATPRVRVNSQVRALATAVESKPESIKTFSIYRWVSPPWRVRFLPCPCHGLLARPPLARVGVETRPTPKCEVAEPEGEGHVQETPHR